MKRIFDLDVLGQQPLLNIYTQISFCYSMTGASSHTAIINTLIDGLKRLSASFPWLAGQVVNEGSSEGNTGIFKIKALEQYPRLVVKDLRHDASIPTMDVLRRAHFPFSMLDESTIAPYKTLPVNAKESALDFIPVFLLQASFITGGLLLTFVGQHNTMDMTGQGQIIHLFSKACRNEQFTTEELSSSSLARRNLVPFVSIDSEEQKSELARHFVLPSPSQFISDGTNDHPTPPPPPKCTWAYFSFQLTSLSAIKSLAAKNISSPSGYVSTDDALSAFLWQSIVRARIPRLKSTAKSTFARAVDVRRYLDIPLKYTGLMQNMTYHTYTLQKLIEELLGSVASQLRSAVDPKTSNLGYNTRALITFLDSIPNKSIISFTAMLDLSMDIMLSSWAKLNCYELDFNLGLGKPEAVRRPRFDPVESLIYLMPRTLEGEITVGVCLRDEDLEKLRADEKFTKYAMYIG